MFDPKKVVAELNRRSPHAPNETKQLVTTLKGLKVTTSSKVLELLARLKEVK